jgi:DNA polymerase elongation subunit (family B)
MVGNGVCFSREQQGFLPFLMEQFYTDRSKFKKEMLAAEQRYEETKDPYWKKEFARLDNLQLARKISLNSAYGSLGSPFFRYFSIALAEGITLSGQLAIQWVASRLNNYINKASGTSGKDYCLCSDTDSVYFSLETLIEQTCGHKSTVDKIKFMDKISEESLRPIIEKAYIELADYMNSYKQSMSMKREVLADRGLFVRKKGYALSVHNSEGVQYDKPKLKVKGLELVKSSTPAIVRDKLRIVVDKVLHGTEEDIQGFVSEFQKEFMTLPFEDIAFPRGLNGLEDYASSTTIYGSKCPAQVRGALLFNHHLKRLGLQNKYQELVEGEGIKFLYLKMPNPIYENIISFTDKLPVEFKLESFIDYDLMFQKTFLDPVDTIIESLKWQSVKTANLEEFFG